MSSLEPIFSERRKFVDDFLARVFTTTAIPAHLARSMNYSLLAGGKRLRPVLCLSCASLFGVNVEQVLPFACAIEMIHTYSLIHDDLPEMDNDDMRRGKPSNHKVFGQASALLAGDALLTEAFFYMTKASVQPHALCRAIAEIASAAGACGMVGGQEMDLALTGKQDVSLDTVKAMHALKTGALLRASCTSGALLANCNDCDYRDIAAFGVNLGIAFQIVDDILDETADPEVLGKPVHSDRDKQKTTYPSLIGLDTSKKVAQEYAKKAQESIQRFSGEDADFLRALTKFTVERVC